MSVLQLPQCPASLKPIQHYLKTASEHETRDPVIAYWCRLYSLQTALKIDKKSDEARALLMKLVDWLEKQKKVLSDNEAVTNEIAAQAHIENYALRLFTWADSQDRAGIFNKNVVKSFYTSAMLMDILTTFGDMTEEISNNCKYAKWKAAYIHNCLKNGEIPVPGPMDWKDANDEDPDIASASGVPQPVGFNVGITGGEETMTPSIGATPPSVNKQTNVVPSQPFSPNTDWASPPPQRTVSDVSVNGSNSSVSATGSNLKLNPSQITKAQKYCKFAGSALNYDDVPEAVNYLQKALTLLQTGEDI